MGTVINLAAMSPQKPPYSSDSVANGYSPRFDLRKIKASKTWLRCPQKWRPWLLMLWMEAWDSVPVGTYPADDDDMIAARIGMSPDEFAKAKRFLLANWTRHGDGLLYHDTITEMVLDMLGKRRNTAEKVGRWRKSRQVDESKGKAPKKLANVTGYKGDVTGYKGDVTGSNGDVTGRKGREGNIHPCIAPAELSHHHPDDDRCVVLDEHPAGDEEAFALTEPPLNGTPQKPKKPPCPYAKIRALWAEILPNAIQPLDVEHWTPARKAQIRARWENDLPDLETWEAMMRSCARSKFLMGKVPPPPGRKPFRLDLFWITKPENLLKLMEGRWHGK